MYVIILGVFALLTGVVAENGSWWEHAVVYQIYPRSFKDTNNDGIGDLKGIIEKIDHFSDMGVDAIWLSPIYQSPQVDQGYDISDYYDVDPDYGTNEILDELVEKAHALGLKVILDYVPNHTSDKHQWFLDSIRQVEPYKDYYIWADAKIDEHGIKQPPNNWISIFKNSAWTWNDHRQQYYLHQFAAAQPDLNYYNSKVVDEMEKAMTFWMDRGIDGFRVDAVTAIFEDEELRDEPTSGNADVGPNDYEYLNHIYTKDHPKTFELVYQWREFIDNYSKDKGGSPRIFVTECYTDINTTMYYYGTPDGSKLGAHFTFNFYLIADLNSSFTGRDVVQVINNWLNTIPDIYISNWVLGNHDNHRVATRLGAKNVDGLNMLMALLPGIGVTYNGEEIGMEDGEIKFEEGRDPSARNPDNFDKISRDFERTPYHWDTSVNAGFNDGAKPWLPVSQKYLTTNLENQKNNTESHYKIYQELMKLRRTLPAQFGTVSVENITENIILLRRCAETDCLALVFNVADTEDVVDIQKLVQEQNHLILKNVESLKELGSTLDVAHLNVIAHEALILRY